MNDTNGKESKRPDDLLEEKIRQRTAALEEANRALLEIKTRFEAVYDHHYQMTGLLDTDGRLLMGNRTAMDFAGIRVQDVIGKLFWETPWWTHSKEIQRKLRDAIERAKTGELVRFECTHMTGSGEEKDIDFCISPAFNDSGEVIYLVPEGYDITERKAAEEALRESEEKYRTFFQNSYDPMIMLRNGLIFDCNAATLSAFKIKDNTEILHTRPSDHSPDYQPDGSKSSDKADAMIEAALTKGTHRFEWIHRNSHGELFPVEVSLTVMPSEGNTTMLAVWRDISERKRAEEERLGLEAQLHQAQKMEAVGQLAGGVAHDFNNVLQAIVGYGQLALEDADPDSTLREELDEVMKAADRATTLVRQLLAFSRRQVLKLETHDLSEVVEEFAKMIRRVIGEHIALNIRSDPGLKTVCADRGQLEQILMNLCVNGRDAMPEGGTLTIRTRDTALDADYCRKHVGAEPGNYVLLSISDTGAGMDEETQRHIFEPFYTTKEEGKGTGLGLSTVYGIVSQHHGMIDVYSEPGIGTQFNIYLPLSETSIEEISESEYAAPPGGTETVLLAEDNESVRDLTRRSLEDAGYTVLAAGDGEEAIRLFDEHAGSIDLALLDVVMPRIGGRAVFNHIRDAGSTIPILFASGYSTAGVHTDFVLEEGMQLIHKPYQRNELLGELRKLLDV